MEWPSTSGAVLGHKNGELKETNANLQSASGCGIDIQWVTSISEASPKPGSCRAFCA